MVIYKNPNFMTHFYSLCRQSPTHTHSSSLCSLSRIPSSVNCISLHHREFATEIRFFANTFATPRRERALYRFAIEWQRG